MTIVDDVKKIINHKGEYDKEVDLALSSLDLRFEIDHSPTDEEFIEAVSLLLNYLFESQSHVLREEIFYVLDDALLYHRFVGPSINWDGLVAEFPSMNIDELIESLLVIGYAKNPKYLPLFESYLQHQNAIVRENAMIGIDVIKGKQ